MISVIVAVVASQFIGMVWYSPYFFGMPWMKRNFPGKSADQISQEGNFNMALSLCVVGQTCLAMVLHYVLLTYLGITCIYAAAKIGLGLGVLVSISDIPHGLFSCRSCVVFIIDHLYDAAVMLAMCVSIVYFR